MNSRQIQREVEWLGKQASQCKICPNKGTCSYREENSYVNIARLNGQIVRCEPGFAHRMGYTVGEILKLNIKNLTSPDCWPLNLGQLECVNKWGVAEFQKWLITKTGTLIPAHLVMSRIHDKKGEPLNMAFIDFICPGMAEAEGYRPAHYPRLVAVN